MNKFLINRYRVTLDTTPWWWRVAYLIIHDFDRFDKGLLEGFEKVVKGGDKAFNNVVDTHVSAYLEHGTPPPAPIAGPIMNIAEDLVAGREPTLRAGDYIALQTYKRAHGK